MNSQARSVKALQLLLGSSGGPDPAGPHQGAVAVAGHVAAEVPAEQQLSQPPPRCGQGTGGRSELPSRRASPSDPVITSLTQPPAPWSRSELSDSPPAEGWGHAAQGTERVGVQACGRAEMQPRGPSRTHPASWSTCPSVGCPAGSGGQGGLAHVGEETALAMDFELGT